MLSSIKTTVRLAAGFGSLSNNPNGPGSVPDHDNDGIHDAEDPDHPAQPPSHGEDASCEDVAAGDVLDGMPYSCAEALLAEHGEMNGCDFPLADWPGSAQPAGTLLSDLCPVTCGNTTGCAPAKPPPSGDSQPHPAHISFITSGRCESTDGCARITSEDICSWIGTAAPTRGAVEMTFVEGNGHFQMGAAQQDTAAPGCVYAEGNRRLKWNELQTSTATCDGDGWGCFCLGTCAEVMMAGGAGGVPPPAPPPAAVAGPDMCSATEAATFMIETHRVISDAQGAKHWVQDRVYGPTKQAAVGLVTPTCAACAAAFAPRTDCQRVYATGNPDTLSDQLRCVHSHDLWSSCGTCTNNLPLLVI